ncbi:MAG: outer membrane protein transport protein [Candidatus Omnitrophica bacterium]|nr:outer membrane protein transport protein [Candidatus Omnitrophota bacterium]
MKKRICTVVFLFIVIGVFIPRVEARFDIIDHGARASGRAGAFVATADDGSAIYYNPAGLTQIKEGLFQEEVFFVFRYSKYESPAGAGEKITQVAMLPNTYLVANPESDSWKFGIGIYVPFGSFTEWSENGPLRYQATYNSLDTVVINPSLAFKINEDISVGLGADIYEGQVVSRKMVNYGRTIPGAADGFYELISEKTYALGYNLGLLYNIDESNRIGVSYRSRFSLYFDGNATISNIPTGAPGAPRTKVEAKAKYKFPDIFMIGYAHEFSDKLEMEADVHWINWSQHSSVLIDFEPEGVFTDTFIAKDYSDAFIYKLGLEYLLNDKFSLRTGCAYSSEPVPAATFDPANPSNRRYSFYFGGGYKKNNFRAEMTLAATFFSDRYVDNSVGASSGTSINGTYKTFIPQVTLGVNWRF